MRVPGCIAGCSPKPQHGWGQTQKLTEEQALEPLAPHACLVVSSISCCRFGVGGTPALGNESQLGHMRAGNAQREGFLWPCPLSWGAVVPHLTPRQGAERHLPSKASQEAFGGWVVPVTTSILPSLPSPAGGHGVANLASRDPNALGTCSLHCGSGETWTTSRGPAWGQRGSAQPSLVLHPSNLRKVPKALQELWDNQKRGG